MNELNKHIKSKTKTKAITVADLRKMGLHSNATAHLFDGTKVTLRKRFCTTTKKGYVDGNLIDVEVMMLYSEVFPKIRTVKRNKVLIARKSREKDDELHYIKKH